MFLIGFPLLLIPFAIYNMLAFLLPGIAWSQELAAVHLISGADWAFTPGELLIAGAIVALFFETLKSTRLTTRSIVDHMLSILLFIAMTAEFVLVKQAASSTFFLLLVISFVDVVGGFTNRAVRRDIVQHDTAQHDAVQHDAARHDMPERDTVHPAAPVEGIETTQPA
jgi:hypothetical protein